MRRLGYMKKARTRSQGIAESAMLKSTGRDVSSANDAPPCESVESLRPLKLLSLTPSVITLTPLAARSSVILQRYYSWLTMDTQKLASMFSGLDAYLLGYR